MRSLHNESLLARDVREYDEACEAEDAQYRLPDTFDIHEAFERACEERGIFGPEDFERTHGATLERISRTSGIAGAYSTVLSHRPKTVGEPGDPPSTRCAPVIDSVFRRWHAGEPLTVREADMICLLWMPEDWDAIHGNRHDGAPADKIEAFITCYAFVQSVQHSSGIDGYDKELPADIADAARLIGFPYADPRSGLHRCDADRETGRSFAHRWDYGLA